MRNFLVVAAGHSGTKFLADQLNTNSSWKVLHEPNDSICHHYVNTRFNEDKYGEVNSWLLSSADLINSKVKAAILRSPYKILSSILRQSEVENCKTSCLIYVRESIAKITSLVLTSNFIPINFDKLTTDKNYFTSVAYNLGVDDLDVSSVNLSPINRHIGEEQTVDLSKTTIDEFNTYCEYFRLAK